MDANTEPLSAIRRPSFTATKSAPADQQLPIRAHLQLIEASYLTVDQIAARAEKKLPKLQDLFRSRAIVVVGREARGYLGSFTNDKWELGGERLHEIHLNTDRKCGHRTVTRGEDATATLAHELAHLYAHHHGIKDTSNRGRYHGKKFAVLAEALGCHTARASGSHYGIVTDCLQDWAREAYADLIVVMDDALRLNSTPTTRPTPATIAPTAPTSPEGKYVFATCACVLPTGRRRTLRMAAGQWPLGRVWCESCRSPFGIGETESEESQPFWSTLTPGSETLTAPASLPLTPVSTAEAHLVR
jgi:hypothetical protein